MPATSPEPSSEDEPTPSVAPVDSATPVVPVFTRSPVLESGGIVSAGVRGGELSVFATGSVGVVATVVVAVTAGYW